MAKLRIINCTEEKEMTFTLIAAGIVAPAVLWVLYFYYKDRFKPEPIINIWLTFLFGFLVGYACYKSYALLPMLGLPEDPSIIMDNDRWLFFWYCLGPVGLLEEIFKFLPFLIVIYFFKAFDEKVDGIIYSCVIALGFASYENFHYLPYLEGFELVGRAVASPLTHGIFASIWGYIVGKAKLTGRSVALAALIGLTISAVFHGLFDFLTTSSTLRVFSAVVILGIWIWRLRTIERASGHGKNKPEVTDE